MNIQDFWYKYSGEWAIYGEARDTLVLKHLACPFFHTSHTSEGMTVDHLVKIAMAHTTEHYMKGSKS